MNKRWEILIPSDDYGEFRELLQYTDLESNKIGVSHRHTGQHVNEPTSWVICYPSEEFKTMAMLKFRIKVLPTYGTEIDFTD